MTYTISQIAEKTGVSAYTLRYYDKEGLLPFVDHVNGRRVFKDSDLTWLKMLSCLKSTGMSIKEIREFMRLCALGDETLLERQEIILNRKRLLEEQIALLQGSLEQLEHKARYYEDAIANAQKEGKDEA